jgi:hypothetical protein
MIKRWPTFVLSMLVIVGTSGFSHADEPKQTLPPLQMGTIIMPSAPMIQAEPILAPESAWIVAPCNQCASSESHHHPILHWLRHPCGCWATVDSVGCSSLKAECTFLFGSCRRFYGEPCLKGPPPIPGLPY